MMGENVLSGTGLLSASCAILVELFPSLGCFPSRKLEITTESGSASQGCQEEKVR